MTGARLSVLVPFRWGGVPNGLHRRALGMYVARQWERVPDVEVIFASDRAPGEKRPAAFNFARAANRARAQATTDRLLLVGADSLPPTPTELDRIMRELDAGRPWLMVYDSRHSFSQATTARILAGQDNPDFTRPDGALVKSCHGVLAMLADVWDDIGGMDEGFEGWGYEDTAMELALATLYPTGDPYGVGTQRALWHPSAAPGKRNPARFEGYVEAAALGPAAMRGLLGKTVQEGDSVPPIVRVHEDPALLVLPAPDADGVVQLEPDDQVGMTMRKESWPGRFPIVMTYAYFTEPSSLVMGLRDNMAWCDGIVPVRGLPWVDGDGKPTPREGEVRAMQQEAVRAAFGDCWVIFMDPDERLDVRAEQEIRAALDGADLNNCYGFPLREMWTPTQYRTDGVWATQKPRWRVCHLHAGQKWRYRPLHSALLPAGRLPHIEIPGAPLYHLKSIEPANRQARARAYQQADPGFKYQRVRDRDWSWLWDEAGLKLADIPDGEGFTPPYIDPYNFIPAGPTQER